MLKPLSKLSSKVAKDAVANVNKCGGESSSNMNKTSRDASEAKNEQRGRSVKTMEKTVDRRKRNSEQVARELLKNFRWKMLIDLDREVKDRMQKRR